MSGSVKSIRHHQSLPGRDEDSAHAQYLRLAETATQGLAGDLDLNSNNIDGVDTLTVASIYSASGLTIDAGFMSLDVNGALAVDVGILEFDGAFELLGELEITTCDDPPLSLIMTALSGESTEGFMWFEGEECIVASADAPLWCCSASGSYNLDGGILVKVGGTKKYIKYFSAV